MSIPLLHMSDIGKHGKRLRLDHSICDRLDTCLLIYTPAQKSPMREVIHQARVYRVWKGENRSHGSALCTVSMGNARAKTSVSGVYDECGKEQTEDVRQRYVLRVRKMDKPKTLVSGVYS